MNPDPNNIPPKLPQVFLQWFLKDNLAEEVLGDLDEKYYQTIQAHSTTKAKLNYWYQVINYLRPFAIKNYRSNLNYSVMYQHHLKIGSRNLLKNKGYSFINLGGLAIGMTIAIFIGLWVMDELSYNKSFDHYEDIAQVMIEHHNYNEQIKTTTSLPPGLGTHLRENFGNRFEQVVIVRSRPVESILTLDDDSFAETGYFMQKDGPDMFSLNMISGSINGLSDMNSILLSHKLAQKLFGDEDPLNKVLKIDGSSDLTITGVYENLPQNTFLSNAAYLAPFELFINGWSDVTVWDNYFTHVFVKLNENTHPDQVDPLIKDLLLPHLNSPGKRYLFLNQMPDWHLYSEFKNGRRITSERLKFVWIFGSVGVFVLALACINFMNLSTAQSEKRAKEIGVRKSIGSARIQLINQFLLESILISFFAFALALIVAALTLPWFNDLSGKGMNLPYDQLWFWISGFTIAFFTGILAGSYPAFYLSSFNPVKSLKGTFRVGKAATLPRKILVVFQFTISIMLITGTLVVYQQIHFVKNRPTGYNKENLLMINKKTKELFGKYDIFRNELKKTGAVLEIGQANYPLTNTLGNNDGFYWEGKAPTFNPSFNTIKVNYDYGKTVEWKVIEGRDFSRDFPGDIRNAVIITQSAKELMGLKDPVGKEIHASVDYYGGPDFKIVGVVKDMIKGNPFESPQPAFMFLTEGAISWMFLRLNPETPVPEALTKIDHVFKDIAPSAPFDYSFMDQEFNAKFKAEMRIGKLITFFTVFAILISCLGLFGLASYMAEKRTKEIGIRKILGAPIYSLWRLLSKDFIVLVIISCVLATPLAHYLLESWLSKYEYSVELSWWYFLLAGAGVLAITLLTVSHQTIKAVLINPVNSLKSE